MSTRIQGYFRPDLCGCRTCIVTYVTIMTCGVAMTTYPITLMTWDLTMMTLGVDMVIYGVTIMAHDVAITTMMTWDVAVIA